jgi:hypothetical protein
MLVFNTTEISGDHMKRLFVLIAITLLGNTSVSDEIPAALQPYVVDGVLKTDDFGWMRGAFDGASEQQKADLEAVNLWVTDCMVAAKLKAVDDLKAMGVTAAKLDDIPAGPALCGSVATYKTMAKQTKNWEAFLVAEKQAREVFSIYEFGAKTAKLHSAYEPNWGIDESWSLLHSAVMEQVYRIGSDWQTDRDAPAIDPALLPYLSAHMSNAIQIVDRKNTAMLAAIIEDKGWPSVPMVGERASFNAWLLVQHADADPALQLKALRLMEPLAAKGEVSKRNYAYLYDRVMLKLNGKQKFGTQIGGCDGEEYAPFPLEDEKRLNELRAGHQLEPITQYLNGFKERRGPCRAN